MFAINIIPQIGGLNNMIDDNITLDVLELYLVETDRLIAKYQKKIAREKEKVMKLYGDMQSEQELEDAYGYGYITEKQLEDGKRILNEREGNIEKQMTESVTQRMIDMLRHEKKNTTNQIDALRETLGIKTKGIDPETEKAIKANIDRIQKAHGLK